MKTQVWISAHRPAINAGVICSFPQSLQADARTDPQLGHELNASSHVLFNSVFISLPAFLFPSLFLHPEHPRSTHHSTQQSTRHPICGTLRHH